MLSKSQPITGIPCLAIVFYRYHFLHSIFCTFQALPSGFWKHTYHSDSILHFLTAYSTFQTAQCTFSSSYLTILKVCFTLHAAYVRAICNTIHTYMPTQFTKRTTRPSQRLRLLKPIVKSQPPSIPPYLTKRPGLLNQVSILQIQRSHIRCRVRHLDGGNRVVKINKRPSRIESAVHEVDDGSGCSRDRPVWV